MEIVWITNPDGYDPVVHEKYKVMGARRVALFAERGFPVRVVHACDLVAACDGRPQLWYAGEDLLGRRSCFMMSSWAWSPDAAQHFRVISRTIRSSDSVLLNDLIRDPERLGADKLAMYQHAGQLGVPVLPTVAVPFGRYAKRALAVVQQTFDGDGYVVKPREMAMGFGVLKADTVAQLAACTDLLAPSALGCIIQPYLQNSGDLRVFVHRGEAVASMLRRPAADAYRANISVGGTPTNGDASPEVAGMSEHLARSVDAEYLCVDWLLSDTKGPVFNEWMTVAANFEDLPEPSRSRVADALFTFISDRLRQPAGSKRAVPWSPMETARSAG
jgi:ribosomal protein S6--L-glutamate ligase